MDNKSKKINDWFDSGEYKTDIDKLRTEIMSDSANSNSEATTASIFEKELYYLIKSKTGLKLDITKEQTLDGINHKFGNLTNRKSGNGRLDAVVNNLIIEYKHYSKLKTKEQYLTASAQTIDYLNALYCNSGVKYNAILTDGIKISYFVFSNDEVKNTALSPITVNDIDTIIKAIVANDTKRFVPSNILKDFSVDLIAPSISKDVALTLYNTLNSNMTDKTNMLFCEWQSLMHLSVEDNGKSNDIEKRRKDLSLIFNDDINDTNSEYMALYALQTTYAIIVKLIACKVIDRLDYNDLTKNYYDLSNITSNEMQTFFEKMEDGYSYRSSNINNFLEGDFFSWYSDQKQWNKEFWQEIIKIVKCIDQYSSFSFNVYYEPIDIFKDLYMSIIPKSIRHSMGEYFTPKWLANYVVKQGVEMLPKGKSWKVIDPCCGSGIFLIESIKEIVGDKNVQTMTYKEKENLKEDIVKRVYGIDINPLSVLSARVGYYLALKPFGNLHDIDIPVFLGDSAILAEEISLDGTKCYKYSVNNLKKAFDVVLPKRYVMLPEFEIIMSQLQSCVKVNMPDLLFDVITDQFIDEEKNNKVLMDKVKDMCESLVMLHENNWDGIWIRIATNFMLIARLNEFDLIVGNPPWVKWEHLPGAYADKIKELCNIKHIFSGAGRFGGTQLNICALIANVTATNWLSKDGVLAFLMPDSIMSQNSYEGFRKFYLDYETDERLFLQKIDRWLPPLRPFRSGDKAVTQDFNTYYYSRNKVDYKKGFQVTNISRNSDIKDEKINEYSEFKDVKKYLNFRNSKALQLSDNSTAFAYTSDEYDFSKIIGKTDYLYRTGVEFTPQELYMLKGKGKTNENSYYLFYNKKFKQSKYKIDDMPSSGWKFNTNFIYPIITGPHITPFHFDSNNEYCILPYTKENTKVPISDKQFMKESKDVFIYLTNHKDLIDKQSERSKEMHRGEEFYSLSKIGPYTFADYIVAARDNSKFCASVINKQITPWGELKNTICVKHTIIISQRKDKKFISEEEAYYLCGILNSKIVKNYIESSFKSNGFSLNKSNIYIPKYDYNNQLHNQISKLSKEASQPECKILNLIIDNITDLYLKICESKNC